ncbi:MAG TPA: hypothetical protein VEG33_21775 [Streptosporangiaceae bacterium]|nr:hypothetical protein [Streptosporangiaceae bacterium]
MTGAGSVSLREIGRVKSAATRVALLPVVDLAGYTANTAFWLARTAANLEAAAARARLHATRPGAHGGRTPGPHYDPQPQQDTPVTG